MKKMDLSTAILTGRSLSSRANPLSGLLTFLFFLTLCFATSAQPAHLLKETDVSYPQHYALLPDKAYTFQQIIADSSLKFIVNDSIRPAKAAAYWLKIIVDNPNPYPEVYNIAVYPNLKNLLYYFDANVGEWHSCKAGILASDKIRRWGLTPVLINGKSKNTLYIKVNVEKLRKFNRSLLPKTALVKKTFNDRREQNLLVAWIAGIVVLVLFFLNNLYVYLSFRDSTVLYYLLAQLGGMIYLTAYWQFFHVLFRCPVFSIGLDLNFNHYDLNFLLMHVGIVLTLGSFVQLTRSYLATKHTLPRLDTLLRWAMNGYFLFSLVLAAINVSGFYVEIYTLPYDNLLALLLVVIVMYTCVIGYRRRLPAATPFLVANMMPLVFMMAIPLFHVLIDYTTKENLFLPDLVIVSQALGFSIALVARTKAIQNALKAKEMEAHQLEFNLREISLRQQLIELENQKINLEINSEKSRNELLRQTLEANQRELASMAMYTAQKNDLLATLKKQIRELTSLNPGIKNQGLSGIESILRSNLYLDSDWRKFKLHFEQVHPHFFQQLRERYPNLSKNEIRLCAYFHINLSTKEIAALLNIDPASVYRAKTRLSKKMSLPEKSDQ